METWNCDLCGQKFSFPLIKMGTDKEEIKQRIRREFNTISLSITHCYLPISSTKIVTDLDDHEFVICQDCCDAIRSAMLERMKRNPENYL